MNRTILATLAAMAMAHLTTAHCYADALVDRAVDAQLAADVAKRKVAESQAKYSKSLEAVRGDLKFTSYNFLACGSSTQGECTELQKQICNTPPAGTATGTTGGTPETPKTCAQLQADADNVRVESQYTEPKTSPYGRVSSMSAHDLLSLMSRIEKQIDETKAKELIRVAPAIDFCPPSDTTDSIERWINACRASLTSVKAKLNTAATDETELNNNTADASLKQSALDRARLDLSNASVGIPSLHVTDRMRGARKARCLTAYCWGGYDGMQYAIEPIVDLPVSMFWALGNGGLANHINSTKLDVGVDAGIRFWLAYDDISFGLLFARPSLTSTSNMRVEGSDKTFPATAVHRPYPTFVVGFIGDIVMLSVSYDQIRNTDGSQPIDPAFTYEQVLSRTFTIGLSLNTFTAARNYAGAALLASQNSQDGGNK